MQNQRAFIISIAVAMSVGTAAGAVIGTLYGNLVLWTGPGPALGFGFAIGPIVAFTQRKSKDPAA